MKLAFQRREYVNKKSIQNKISRYCRKTIAIDRANAIGITYANSNVLLGKYTSKEKALKVLDLIGQADNNFEMGFRCDVFQMPKDEEVNELYNKEYIEALKKLEVKDE